MKNRAFGSQWVRKKILTPCHVNSIGLIKHSEGVYVAANAASQIVLLYAGPNDKQTSMMRNKLGTKLLVFEVLLFLQQL